MNFESWLIVWSIRLSMLLFVTTLLTRLVAPKAMASHASIKLLWTAGFALFVVHVLASFHFVHHWSHSAAYEATAKQTGQLLGIEFGGGVYFNYLFLIAWGGDVWHTWYPISRQRWIIHWLLRLGLLYMLFIAFNGVVVFKSGWLRMMGIGATLILLTAFASKLASYQVGHRDKDALTE